MEQFCTSGKSNFVLHVVSFVLPSQIRYHRGLFFGYCSMLVRVLGLGGGKEVGAVRGKEVGAVRTRVTDMVPFFFAELKEVQLC